MTYISRTSDFVSYPAECVTDEHHTFGIISQFDAMIDLIVNAGHDK